MCNSSLNPAADDNLNLHWRYVVPDSPKLQGLAHQKDQACAPLPLAALDSSCSLVLHLRSRTRPSHLFSPSLSSLTPRHPPLLPLSSPDLSAWAVRDLDCRLQTLSHTRQLPLTPPVRLRGGRSLPQLRSSASEHQPPHQGRTPWLRQQDHAFLTSRHRQPPRWPRPPCQPT